ncbi:MAG: hypothetical protein AAF960_07120 [Bacteroidota bacterium]
MKRLNLGIIGLLYCYTLVSQTPLDAPLPEKFAGMKEIILVDNFPNPVKASTYAKEPNKFFWKHTTSILSTHENITIEEGGAYLFYDKKWNLRVAYPKKKFAKLYKVPKGKMKKGEPYVFVRNWRVGPKLFGGWAMWYVIGTTDSGERVFGVGRLDTVGEVYVE